MQTHKTRRLIKNLYFSLDLMLSAIWTMTDIFSLDSHCQLLKLLVLTFRYMQRFILFSKNTCTVLTPISCL